MELVPPPVTTVRPQCISISLTREEVKLSLSKDPWRPARLKNDLMDLSEEEVKTQVLYKNFRDILNKFTLQKFDTWLNRVRGLEITTQARLEGIVDIIFKKAIKEPNFSEAYAMLCMKLSQLKVPRDNASDQYVNFRGLIISRCQNQFMNKKIDEQVLKLEKEVEDCDDPVKKKELLERLAKEQRRVSDLSVGNAKFIGELYKLGMLTSKIMTYCMKNLVNEMNEENLESLCKLLTTIGQKMENDYNHLYLKNELDDIFKTLYAIDFRKTNGVSSRVRFIIQDVIDLRNKSWITKDERISKQPKTMDQIIEEAEQQKTNIKFINDCPSRDERRGNVRRQASNSIIGNQNQWKAVTLNTQKNLIRIKLAPPTWRHNASRTTRGSVDTVQNPPSHNTNNSRVVSSTSRSSSGRGNINTAIKRPEKTLPQEPLSEGMKRKVKLLVMENLVNPNDEEFVSEFKDTLPGLYHSAAVTEILNIALEKSTKNVQIIAKSTNRLISSGTVSGEHFLSGVTGIMECAPDLYIDIPMLYEYLGKFTAPLIEGKHITFAQLFGICQNIIKSNHGHLFLRPLIRDLIESAGSSFVKMIWSQNSLELKQWINEEQIPKWLEDNKFDFLVDDKATEAEKRLSAIHSKFIKKTQSILLQLMNSEENCECILEWIRNNVGASSTEDWFMRALIQAICEHALSGDNARFSYERMAQYSPLISEFGHSREQREANCLLGIQQLMLQLQYPPGLAIEIFQFLLEQYIISVEGFTAWEVSELEPEGKEMMLRALKPFFTNIREATESSDEE
ncbi:eukaryotic translation initiation factor 4 gamma 1-like isoform X2 [Bicyclus anynana]|nr:eukaryotic translation initiation factor 4 gamma 1-like isoform X2 [Bicyclus anynana]XP_052742440.1 eukaryotic translation initiation factor 4 gamma 1-like isoform X2 [Bicyclus anynana]XP_052742441.1 eukaryotic translation initiation factor 4 gamma 1-like isoform X2 [Bicyclus anynana]